LNKKGVLGYKLDVSENPDPKQVLLPTSNKVIKVDAGVDFNLALTEDGKLYSWGNNDYGQLGNNSTVG